jgi:hypothetical protein
MSFKGAVYSLMIFLLLHKAVGSFFKFDKEKDFLNDREREPNQLVAGGSRNARQSL